MSITALNPFGDMPSAAAGKLPAAPDTSTSNAPKAACAASSAAAMAAGSRTSAGRPIDLPPSACSSATAAATRSAERLATATLAPRVANALAMPRLMPLVPPATNTVRPEKLKGSMICSGGTVDQAISGGSSPVRAGGAKAAALLRHHALGRGFQIECGGEQRAGVVALRLGEHFRGNAFLDDLAVAHD